MSGLTIVTLSIATLEVFRVLSCVPWAVTAQFEE